MRELGKLPIREIFFKFTFEFAVHLFEISELLVEPPRLESYFKKLTKLVNKFEICES